MNIATIYKEMENRQNLNLPVYLGYLQEHINSPSFSLMEILSKDNKYLRALAIAAFDVKKPKMLFELITKDSQMTIFTSHMALIKCSAELLNNNNSNQDLEVLIEHVIDAVRLTKVKEPGTTLSFAFGFVLGTAIKRGVNVKSFFNKLDSSFIQDNDLLFYGFNSGLMPESTLLVLNENYLINLSERYDNWEDRSRILSLSIFKSIPIDKFSAISINESNLKVLEYFSGRNSGYDKFLSEYQKRIHTFSLQKENVKAKQNIVSVVQTNDSNPTVNNPEVNSIIQKQEQEINSLTNELSLYKSVFKQFEILFPDLQKTLQTSDNDLLSKIQDLVTSQKDNIKNLQNYYEEGERQKAIKDGFKKRL